MRKATTVVSFVGALSITLGTLGTMGALSGCHMGLLVVAFGAGYANGPYEPGSLAKYVGGPAAMRTIGCLDIGLGITEGYYESLLEMHVGNRCDRAEPFDLTALTIYDGLDSSGNRRTVSLYDPRNEIGPLHVGAHEHGHERIRLSKPSDLTHVCFELGRTTPEAPHAHPAPLCLDVQPDGSWISKEPEPSSSSSSAASP